MDRLRALATFKAVAEQGAFVRAADALDMSCASVTRTVQDLESLLGVRLLQRSTRRVSLTAVGREVLSHASRLLDGYEALTALSSLSASEARGKLRVSAPALYARQFVGPALASFVARHPKVHIDLRTQEGSVDLVADGIDLAVCLEGNVPTSVVARRVADLTLGLFASTGYLRQAGMPAHPGDLVQHRCLVREDRGLMDWQFRHAGGATAAPVVMSSMRCPQEDVLLGAALHGAGVVLLPLFVATEFLRDGRLHRLLPDWACPPLGLQLAYASRHHQPLALCKLMEHLGQALGSAGDAAPGAPLPLAA